MKNLTYYEKKNSVLGIILMSVLIVLYSFFTRNFPPAEIFRWMFPIVWGIYSLILLVSVMGQRSSVVVFVSNDWILRAANFLCVMGILVGYVFYVYPVPRVDLQQSAMTAYVVLLMFLYMWSVFHEKNRRPMGMYNGRVGMDDLYEHVMKGFGEDDGDEVLEGTEEVEEVVKGSEETSTEDKEE